MNLESPPTDWSQREPHDWRKGLAIFTVVEMPPTTQPDVVITDFGLVGGPRATLLIDEMGRISFQVVDKDGRRDELWAHYQLFRDNAAAVLCELLPPGHPAHLGSARETDRDKWDICLQIRGPGNRFQRATDCDFAVEVPDNRQSLGVDIEGKRPAAFRLKSLQRFAAPLTPRDSDALLQWAKDVHGARIDLR